MTNTSDCVQTKVWVSSFTKQSKLIQCIHCSELSHVALKKNIIWPNYFSVNLIALTCSSYWPYFTKSTGKNIWNFNNNHVCEVYQPHVKLWNLNCWQELEFCLRRVWKEIKILKIFYTKLKRKQPFCYKV